ncbi:hypothetical protein EZV62_011780 [Acer yangbiense]|uniref:Uncharacterized protein n=1 Tax=Acer yangbiense TaxID=1000413 RepID=A0A5C7I8V2_9ROSI|nr:hypothetical protein EZV62_011780 [Acer yangbiense]
MIGEADRRGEEALTEKETGLGVENPHWVDLNHNLHQIKNLIWIQHQTFPHRQLSAAVDVLHSIESFFHSTDASCKLNPASFTVDITASKDHCKAIVKNEVNKVDEATGGKHLQLTYSSSSCFHVPLSFRVLVCSPLSIY